MNCDHIDPSHGCHFRPMPGYVIAVVFACWVSPSMWCKLDGLLAWSGLTSGALCGSLVLEPVAFEEPAFAIAQGRRVVQTSPK